MPGSGSRRQYHLSDLRHRKARDRGRRGSQTREGGLQGRLRSDENENWIWKWMKWFWWSEKHFLSISYFASPKGKRPWWNPCLSGKSPAERGKGWTGRRDPGSPCLIWFSWLKKFKKLFNKRIRQRNDNDTMEIIQNEKSWFTFLLQICRRSRQDWYTHKVINVTRIFFF